MSSGTGVQRSHTRAATCTCQSQAPAGFKGVVVTLIYSDCALRSKHCLRDWTWAKQLESSCYPALCCCQNHLDTKSHQHISPKKSATDLLCVCGVCSINTLKTIRLFMAVTHRVVKTSPLIQQHAAIKVMTQREQMREIGVSGTPRYACTCPGFPSVTGDLWLLMICPRPNWVWLAEMSKDSKGSNPRVTWRTRMLSWMCLTAELRWLSCPCFRPVPAAPAELSGSSRVCIYLSMSAGSRMKKTLVQESKWFGSSTKPHKNIRAFQTVILSFSSCAASSVSSFQSLGTIGAIHVVSALVFGMAAFAWRRVCNIFLRCSEYFKWSAALFDQREVNSLNYITA